MLKTISFHASLLKRPLLSGKKSVASHVLLYGAIEIHAMGPKGCIASNTLLGKEIGLSTSRVADLLTDLSKSGWVKIILDKENHRVRIDPVGEIKFTPPSRGQEPPLPADRNIDNNLDNIKDNVTKVTKAPKEKEENLELKLFYLVLKHYGLPPINNNNVRKWAADIAAMPDGLAYLQMLLDKDLRLMDGEFKPTLNRDFDVLSKKVMIQRFYNNGEDVMPRDPRVYGDM